MATVSLIIAILALLISAWNAVHTFRESRQKLRRDLEVTSGINPGGPNPSGGRPRLLHGDVWVRAVNRGTRPVTVQAVWVVTTKGVIVDVPPSDQGDLPITLNDGETFLRTFNAQELQRYEHERGRRVEHVTVTDTAGKHYDRPYRGPHWNGEYYV
jgi:hypothetical protein